MNTYEVNYIGRGHKDKKDYVRLLSCPFCGSYNLEVCNTHTPSFWVNCFDCEGQAHGKYRSGRFKAALMSAVVAWDRRSSGAKREGRVR
jgi:transcription elongation factor Elf1